MKSLFVCVAALGLLALAPVSAQSNDHRDGRHDTAGPSATTSVDAQRSGRHGMKKASPPARSADTYRDRSGRYGAGESGKKHRSAPATTTTRNQYLPTSGDVREGPMDRTAMDRNRDNSRRLGNVHSNPANRSVTDRNRSNSRWSGNATARNHDHNALRRNMQASRRYHSGSYLRPAGYQHRHWGHGERLPRAYYVDNYWISNFLMFGLFAPPTNLVWVRVGDDALLVDRYTGDIVQVRYGVFY